jgi:hypothetical protein
MVEKFVLSHFKESVWIGLSNCVKGPILWVYSIDITGRGYSRKGILRKK